MSESQEQKREAMNEQEFGTQLWHLVESGLPDIGIDSIIRLLREMTGDCERLSEELVRGESDKQKS